MSATPYATPQSLVDEFGAAELVSLTDRGTPRADAVDEAVAQRACDRAAAEINGHLRARYTLPLPSVPELLPYLARDLAHFYLYETEPPTFVQARYDAARRTLRDIQSGVQPLGIDDAGVDVGAAPVGLPQFVPGEKVFARGEA